MEKGKGTQKRNQQWKKNGKQCSPPPTPPALRLSLLLLLRIGTGNGNRTRTWTQVPDLSSQIFNTCLKTLDGCQKNKRGFQHLTFVVYFVCCFLLFSCLLLYKNCINKVGIIFLVFISFLVFFRFCFVFKKLNFDFCLGVVRKTSHNRTLNIDKAFLCFPFFDIFGFTLAFCVFFLFFNIVFVCVNLLLKIVLFCCFFFLSLTLLTKRL